MIKKQSLQPRILALAPSTKGIGFAVIDANGALADWGLKRLAHVDNDWCVLAVEKLLKRYQPGLIVLEDYWAADVRRVERIKDLGHRLISLAKNKKLRVVLTLRKHVSRAILGADGATRWEIAEHLAKKFPEQLGFRLPPKRRFWMNEDPRMSIFTAVSLAISIHSKTAKQ